MRRSTCGVAGSVGTAKDAACLFSGKDGGTPFLASPQVAGRASHVLPAKKRERVDPNRPETT